jgi:hypothetical protein
MVTLRKSCTWYNPMVLLILRMLTRYANFNDLFMDRSKRPEVGISILMKSSKGLDLSKLMEKLVFTRK